jgi:hypothetical protein
MGEFDPKELVINLASEIAAQLENEWELKSFLQNQSSENK